MPKSAILNALNSILTEIITKGGLFFVAVSGSLIIFIDAMQVKKQAFIHALFGSVSAFILGYSVGWIVSGMTENKSAMLIAALVSCLASRSLISYVMTKTSVHVDNILKNIVDYFKKKSE